MSNDRTEGRSPHTHTATRSETDCHTVGREGLRDEKNKPPQVVCLCGSSRFVAEMAVLAWTIERDKGHIVLGLHLLPVGYPNCPPHHLAEQEGVKERMDELHKRKIDLADKVVVVNLGGYIGESTRSEIEYAREHGKPVLFVEPESAKRDGWLSSRWNHPGSQTL